MIYEIAFTSSSLIKHRFVTSFFLLSCPPTSHSVWRCFSHFVPVFNIDTNHSSEESRNHWRCQHCSSSHFSHTLKWIFSFGVHHTTPCFCLLYLLSVGFITMSLREVSFSLNYFQVGIFSFVLPQFSFPFQQGREGRSCLEMKLTCFWWFRFIYPP